MTKAAFITTYQNFVLQVPRNEHIKFVLFQLERRLNINAYISICTQPKSSPRAGADKTSGVQIDFRILQLFSIFSSPEPKAHR